MYPSCSFSPLAFLNCFLLYTDSAHVHDESHTFLSTRLYLYIYTHTHTRIYIYIYFSRGCTPPLAPIVYSLYLPLSGPCIFALVKVERKVDFPVHAPLFHGPSSPLLWLPRPPGHTQTDTRTQQAHHESLLLPLPRLPPPSLPEALCLYFCIYPVLVPPLIMSKRVAVGCDHAAYATHQEIMDMIKATGAASKVMYMGPSSNVSVDYPDYAAQVCEAILKGEADTGILICGTGIGMSIAANKFRGIRAALCYDHVTARLSRQHNNAHVLCIGVRTSGMEIIRDIIETFLRTEPLTEGRHGNRIHKITVIEEEQMKDEQQRNFSGCGGHTEEGK
ncbi:ribose 5-phosphate isomerase, putative [Leishmania tarentolae]|uniref:Ribose 5-phosphate isomerase, putative n=1 Tax=Leishmania tarentolae TaxID=5689 RepID=A0A640KK64_LEITA|nr:ribose 5-phosphate isomerase, putative [Leishmania tarentolae]